MYIITFGLSDDRTREKERVENVTLARARF